MTGRYLMPHQNHLVFYFWCPHRHRCHHCWHCFVDVASSSSPKWGGGKFPWYLSYVFLRRIFSKAACGLWKQLFYVITIPLTSSRQMQNLSINHWWKRGTTKGGYCKHGRSRQYAGGPQRMTATRSFFGLTGGTQFSTIYSIQYGCLGRQ